MLKNLNLKKKFRVVIQGLPLAGIILGSFLPMSTLGRQLLILVLLVWLQVYYIFDVLLNGK